LQLKEEHMNGLTMTTTTTTGAVPGELAGRPVVLVHARHETSAPREWAEALAAALHTGLVDLQLPGGDTEAEDMERLARALRSLAPRLVVLPSAVGGPCESAARLAAECGVPFLVARPRRARRGVLAATSLEDARHPVLREAARVAGALGRPLTCLHNTRTRVLGADRGPGSAGLEQRLDRLATELGADVVLTRAQDPVSGIIQEARREEADLIVVGTAPSPADTGPVGARVAGLARRSVLVVPLSPP
jgi:nucleotide-binding universal stress UspA family protein